MYKNFLYKLAAIRRFSNRFIFSSLTRRILALNLAALFVLFGAVLYSGNFRYGLVQNKLSSMITQADIISDAVSSSVFIRNGHLNIPNYEIIKPYEQYPAPLQNNLNIQASPLDFSINRYSLVPNNIVTLFTNLSHHSNLRLRLYDANGKFLLDSSAFYHPIRHHPNISTFRRLMSSKILTLLSPLLPNKKPLLDSEDLRKRYIRSALNGRIETWIAQRKDGTLVLSVAMPVTAADKSSGALVLSSLGDDIDSMVEEANEHIFIFAIIISSIFCFLSLYLAYTIASPLRRLTQAAEKASSFRSPPTKIPQFEQRYDEVKRLAAAMNKMTLAFYNHLEIMEAFAQDVSHELKNPLSSLSSAIESLHFVKDNEQRSRLEKIMLADIQRMSLLISDISDASKIDAELARDSYSYINLETLLEEKIAIANDFNNSKNIKFSLQVFNRQRPYVVQGHESRLSQVFDNLIDNAVAFVPKQAGKINFILNQNASRIIIYVEDNGGGIKDNHCERIFERFYTNRTSYSKFGVNSGLGLSISKQIIEAHRGSIEAENIFDSKGNKLGARFIITLPFAVL